MSILILLLQTEGPDTGIKVVTSTIYCANFQVSPPSKQNEGFLKKWLVSNQGEVRNKMNLVCCVMLESKRYPEMLSHIGSSQGPIKDAIV